MNATTLGKLLVFFTLVVSLVLSTLAMGVATNRIDWAGSLTPGESEGVHAQKRAEIEQLQDNLLRFRSRWKAENEKLAILEKKRPENQAWYAKEVKSLYDTGPIRNTEYEKDGRLKVEKDVFDMGKPVMVENDDKRLEPLAVLTKKLDDLNGDIAKVIDTITKLVEQQAELTAILRGDPGKIKGLNALLDEAKLAQENSKKALDSAEKEATNGRVASESLQQRSRQLERRIAELKKHLREIAEANP